MNNELEDFISNNLEAFNNKTPDPAIMERIQRQMKETGKKKETTIVVSMRTLLRVAACIIVLAGAGIFWLMQKETTVITAKVEPAANNSASATPKSIVLAHEQNKLPAEQQKENIAYTVAQEQTIRKQAFFAKLNDMESASQRLTAASQTLQLKNTGNDIVDALVKTMDTDPSTNVRLAALEGLSRFYREAYVKKQLIASLKKQKDPIVQIGLIELLTKMKETTILTELDKIVNDANTLEAVKDHAYSSILTLRS